MLSQSELVSWLEPYLQEQMQQLQIAGTVISIVQGKEIILSQGYGLANLEHSQPIKPEKTVFRVGSVSKLFTATAIMQLVEQGKINLNDELNQYIPEVAQYNPFAQPITVAHLLTHTAGLDEYFIGLEALQPDQELSLKEYLQKKMPPVVIPPGTVINYSNHGMALAGYLVEVLTKMSFSQYVETAILQPLAMNSSSFELTSSITANLATGYESKGDRLVAVPWSYIRIPAGGGLNATAIDMAKFIMAHLQSGGQQSFRLLQPQTLKQMHQQQFTNHPRLPGFTYGFYQDDRNYQAILHEGTVRGFASLLWLLPESDIGLFVACNLEEPQLGYGLIQAFLNRYYPCDSTPIEQSLAAEDLNYCGYYRSLQTSRTTIQKIISLFNQIQIKTDNRGLVMPQPRQSESSTWVKVASGLFQTQDGKYAAFVEDQSTRLLIDWSAWEKLPWYATRPVQLGILGLCLAVFALVIIIKITLGISLINGLTDLTVTIAIALNWLSVLGFLVVSSNPNGLTYGVPPLLVAVLCLPLISGLLTVYLAIISLIAWQQVSISLLSLLFLITFIITNTVFIYWLHYWNLLGFRWR